MEASMWFQGNLQALDDQYGSQQPVCVFRVILLFPNAPYRGQISRLTQNNYGAMLAGITQIQPESSIISHHDQPPAGIQIIPHNTNILRAFSRDMDLHTANDHFVWYLVLYFSRSPFQLS